MAAWEVYVRIGERRQRLVRRGDTEPLSEAVRLVQGIVQSMPLDPKPHGLIRAPTAVFGCWRYGSSGVFWTSTRGRL